MELSESLSRLSASVGVGFLMGLVRERNPGTQAGVRTYALVAMLGSVGAMLIDHGVQWLLPAGLVMLGAMMIAALHGRDASHDAGTTSTVAVMLCFCLGAAIWIGPVLPPVLLGLAATALLHFKPELEGFATRLKPADVRSILRFAAVSLLVLPLLPDAGYGPYDSLNPYRIWWMVVLISGIGLTGYLLLQLLGSGRGALFVGVLGGLVSSTATSLTFARQVREDREQADSAQVVILLANLVVLLRLAAFTAVVCPGALRSMLPVLGAGLAPGAIAAGRSYLRNGSRHDLGVSNPGEMLAALGFAALYAIVILVVAWLNDRIGTQGVYLAAAVSGLIDLDAIGLSTMHMVAAGTLTPASLAIAMVIAYIASLAFKFGMIAVVAGRPLAQRLIGPFALIAAGLLFGIAFA
ncbi:uncharacterized membrane protein (DUF4010 family) [Panacagrimonas perspica]|uniref:Uncharacterized membrane protein (DUF4010 family) n=1 Tax=Panacagrimonas perspica TaxID=381431 RepID=A0A4R7PCC1_9GAMM|nr:DUF4010 domain-containing protein [Panacagrimonas perspica]TDU31668.1 uncharacterized membrane protein (DUF4010 family) [Panacagrimonas perspica]